MCAECFVRVMVTATGFCLFNLGVNREQEQESIKGFLRNANEEQTIVI